MSFIEYYFYDLFHLIIDPEFITGRINKRLTITFLDPNAFAFALVSFAYIYTILEKSLGDLLLDEPVDVSPVINADPILRTTENSIPTVERNNQSRLKSDEVELNTVEKTVENKTPIQKDSEIDLLSSQLDTLKVTQEPLKIKFAEDVEVKKATEELDELNTKSKELDEVVTDFINCRNGR